jgi:hypothetical protein
VAGIGEDHRKDRAIIRVLDPAAGIRNLGLRLRPLGLRIQIVMVLEIHAHRHPDLAHIREAAGLSRRLSRLRENRKEDRRQDCDNGDHNE